MENKKKRGHWIKLLYPVFLCVGFFLFFAVYFWQGWRRRRLKRAMKVLADVRPHDWNDELIAYNKVATDALQEKGYGIQKPQVPQRDPQAEGEAMLLNLKKEEDG